MTGYTGHEDDVKRFNAWFGDNYKLLSKHCKRYRIEEDYLHECYYNIQQRIVKSGYTGSQYITFVKRSLKNYEINEKKKNNNKYFIEIDNTDYTNTIEDKLQDKDCEEKDTLKYREDLLYFSKMLFKYIETVKKYDEEWQFVFRCYFLMPKRFTYAKLTIMTGINKNKCTKIIQTMKSDIKDNFINWLKQHDATGSNRHNE